MREMNSIGENIKEARKKRNYTQMQLAEEIGMSVQSIIKIENGTNQPNSTTIAKILDVLDVSANEIFGSYDDGMTFGFETSIARNISRIRNEYGASQESLAERAGISVELLRKVENGNTLPSLELLKRIASAMNVDEAELRVNDDFQRRVEEKELIDLLKLKGYFLQEAESALGYGDIEEGFYYDEEQETEVPIIHSAETIAKDILKKGMGLNEMNLGEIIDIYNYVFEKRIDKLLGEIYEKEFPKLKIGKPKS